MENIEVRWCSLENSDASAGLKQHGFKVKPNGNNISLCGSIVHSDGNKIDELSFKHIQDEGINEHCCKNCKKVYQSLTHNPKTK